jgi:predicted metalloprotease
MKWQKDSNEANIEDRRGQRAGGGGLRMPGGKLSLGGVVVLLIAAFFGRDLFTGGGGGAGGISVEPAGSPSGAPYQASPEEEKLRDFSVFVFNRVQEFWHQKLPADTRERYRDARFVFFTEGTSSGCGDASAEIGPFYCPADEKVYIDLTFFAALQRHLGAPGDFAQAYVIAHEVAHHVQNIRGDNERVQRASRAEQNEMSIRLELQADCLAGVWAKQAEKEGRLEVGDIEEGLGAASAVGDDRLQKMGGGRVNRESWTHGSSAQRVGWFKKGFAGGNVADCDTFSGGI